MSRQNHEPSFYESPYPGVRNPYNEFGPTTSSIVPFSGGETPVTPVETVAKATKSGLSIPNLNEIKGFIDRMGGIEGIVSTVGKVQKVMQSVQQMAPVVKMMMDTLLPGKKKAVSLSDGDYAEWKKRRRRRKKRTGSKKQVKKSKTKAVYEGKDERKTASSQTGKKNPPNQIKKGSPPNQTKKENLPRETKKGNLPSQSKKINRV